MDKHAIFDAWAPPDGRWTPWARPVVFGFLPRPLPPHESEPWVETDWLPRRPDTAIVIDTPGPQAVALSLQVARLGYRPVPLFNACPPPLSDAGAPLASAVDVDGILASLIAGTESLRDARLSREAPPAFLLDADRMRVREPLTVGDYDNRSMVLSSDFPSVNTLRSHGIDRVVLIRQGSKGIELDLLSVLGEWRRKGLDISAKWLDGGALHRLRLPVAAGLLSVWARLRSLLLYRNAAREYGGIVRSAG